ncbi:MAG: phosphoribosyl-AMP cyclohydrolase [Alphaproteobacteria bacterium GM202ARS2]|nr:phosphoribosyl-AMP cyclohydrolase [Alphaproteobacteria bacterium GM202ARS2]
MAGADIDVFVREVRFNGDGLVAVVAVDDKRGDVLMMAWMNEEAVRRTLQSGDVHYWSRSRGTLWRKGETSGQTQTLKSMAIDCDGDTLLVRVEQKGVACHTGRRTCFYREWREGKLVITHEVEVAPDTLYGKK